MSESCDEEFDDSLEQVRGRARHSRVGGNPQGRARVKTMPQHRHVIADLIRNPERQGVWATTRQTNHPGPSLRT